jgi:hypothetical protein
VAQRRQHGGATAAGHRRRRRNGGLTSPESPRCDNHFTLLRRSVIQTLKGSKPRSKPAILGFSPPPIRHFRPCPATPDLSNTIPLLSWCSPTHISLFFRLKRRRRDVSGRNPRTARFLLVLLPFFSVSTAGWWC